VVIRTRCFRYLL